jgi:hypothetical protein
VREAALATRLRDARGRVDLESHLKFADALAEKYAGRNPQAKADFFAALKPSSWGPDEDLRPHETVHTENFNTSNSTTLGPNLTWTETTGDMDVSSNQCRQVSGGSAVSIARAEHDASSVDCYAQVTISGGDNTTLTGRSCACLCRMASGAETAYLARQFGGASSQGTFRPAKIVAGTITNLGSGTTQTQQTVKKVSANGTTIKVYSGGSEVESITDSSIDGVTAGGTRGGLLFSCGRVNFIFDDFEFGDLAAGIVYTQLERGIRGLNRGFGGEW